MVTRTLMGGSVALLALVPTAAFATPKPLPFTYGVDTNAKGQGEVEQYVDLVPVYALDSNAAAQRILAMQVFTEIEYGLSDRVELGLYVTLAPTLPGFVRVPTLTDGNGSKQRIRWRLADQGDWPIDVALYGEVTENNLEIELEAKVILEKRFGHLRLLANAWVEYELYFSGRREWVLNPTAGLTYQVTPNVFPGIEYWMRVELPESGASDFNSGPHHYLGPTLRLAFGNFFWTSGLYARMSNVGYHLKAGDDSFGPFWFRTLVGFGF